MREIKHSWFLRNGKKYYFCNEAVKPNPEKLAHKEEEVNCKNCRKMMGHYSIGMEEPTDIN
jgi:hypothetical protein